MVRIRQFSVFAVIAAVIFFSFEETFALKCWRCSSDASNAPFCNDPFDESKISDEQRGWAYFECPLYPIAYPPNKSYTRAVCKKVMQVVRNETTILRSCFWEDMDTPQAACDRNSNSNPSFVKIEFCETCFTDGCNK